MNNDIDKLLLIDGSNLLFQMFYGMPSRIINKDGKAIQGTLGFVGALLKIIRRTEPTHIAVIFDGEHENSRTELDSAYKSNRPDYSALPEEETPFSQLSDIYEALDFLGISHTETMSCEADDVLAAYAMRFGDKMQVVISSFDSDLFQLITDNVSVLRYRGDNTVICTPEYIREKLGIKSALYADYKSLTGDNADNIRGADKVGPKTAAALVNEFGCLESIIENAEHISKPSVRMAITDGSERLRVNYKLIKLTDRAELPFELSELKYSYSGITTNEVLISIGLK